MRYVRHELACGVARDLTSTINSEHNMTLPLIHRDTRSNHPMQCLQLLKTLNASLDPSIAATTAKGKSKVAAQQKKLGAAARTGIRQLRTLSLTHAQMSKQSILQLEVTILCISLTLSSGVCNLISRQFTGHVPFISCDECSICAAYS
jgi:hypothetical protein